MSRRFVTRWRIAPVGLLALSAVLLGCGDRAGAEATGYQVPANVATQDTPAAAIPANLAAPVVPPLLLDADSKEVWFAIFAPDGKTLATGGNDGILKLWEVGSNRPTIASEPAKNLFRSGAFAPDSKTVATGCLSGAVIVWDAASARPLKRLKEHTAWIRCVSFSPDGKRLVAAGQDNKLTVWDTATWKVVGSLSDQPQSILSAAISPDSKLLAVARGDSSSMRAEGGVRLYDFDTLTEQGDLPGIKSTIFSVAFSPDGRTLATGTGTVGSLQLWDPIARRLRAALKIPHQVRVVAFSPDGKSLITAGASSKSPSGQREGVGQLLNLETLQPKSTVGGHRGLIVAASFSPDGRHLATASLSAPEARIWELAKLPPAPVPGAPGALVPGGNTNVAGMPELQLRTVLTKHVGEVWFAVFAPDCQTVATGGNEPIVRLWDTQTGAEQATWKTPGLGVKLGQ